jgi:hypothetical protein
MTSSGWNRAKYAHFWNQPARPGLMRHYREAGPRGRYCVQCTVKSDKLDCKNYRGICQLNVTYKVFAKILYDRLLPHANAAVQHYQDGFQSGKSTTDQLFALRQILEKCNEFTITMHHLFKDF